MTDRRKFLKNGMVALGMSAIGGSGVALANSGETKNERLNADLQIKLAKCSATKNFIKERLYNISIPRFACIRLELPNDQLRDEKYFKIKDSDSFNIVKLSKESIDLSLWCKNYNWKIIDSQRFEYEKNSICQEFNIEIGEWESTSYALVDMYAQIENKLFLKALDEKGLFISSWKQYKEELKQDEKFLLCDPYRTAFLIANHKTIKDVLRYHKISKDFEVKQQSDRSNCIGFLGGDYTQKIIPGRFRRIEIIANDLVEDDRIYFSPMPEELGFFWINQDLTILPHNDGSDKYTAYGSIGLVTFNKDFKSINEELFS